MTGIVIKEPDIDKSIVLNDKHRAIVGHYESFDKRLNISVEYDRIVAELHYKIDHLPTENIIL